MSKMGNYDGAHDDGPGFVGIKFCQECNNMLYPKEDKENKVLMYAVSQNYQFLIFYLIGVFICNFRLYYYFIFFFKFF